jgi:hypothetical protein
MRLERYFVEGMKPTVSANPDAPLPLHAFAFGPLGSSNVSQWAEIYRLAYQRTVESLQPTRYDFAMKAFAN